ncbi:MAG TPA: hypothetical protein DIU15_13305 [Deltaproteobacteria bacterium]|nr:hypothetical protein [Deltaproteobacteria bacterium]HCP47017.1 hypothetical protein [Deltaproteobacteria bacterium]
MQDDPNARAIQHGWTALEDAELLSFLLTRGGLPGPSALETARWLLRHVGGLKRLSRAPEGQLCQVAGIGPVRARRVLALMTLSRRMSEQPLYRGDLCDSPDAVFNSLKGRLGLAACESFLVVLLDARLRKLAEVEIARGQANAVAVTPRDVFVPAVLEGAVSIVLVHNHPSGDPRPSLEDIALTMRLQRAGELLGIPIRDHLVITARGFTSMAAQGHVPQLRHGDSEGALACSPRWSVDDQRPDRHNGRPCTLSCSSSTCSGDPCPTTPMEE